MAKLRDSENFQELRLLYDQIWSKLQEHEEEEARQLFQSILDEAERRPSTQSLYSRIRHFIQTPLYLASIIIGVLIVPVFILLVVWVSLLLE